MTGNFRILAKALLQARLSGKILGEGIEIQLPPAPADQLTKN